MLSPADPFAPVVAFTLHEEGGWSNSPTDPGGATHYGVTLATFRAYYRQPLLTAADLKAMTVQTATEIYQELFWDAPGFDQLLAGVSLPVFDFGVNESPATSAEFLQQACGAPIDGIVGPVTLAAARVHDPRTLIDTLTTLHQAHYRSRPNFWIYGSDWIARTERARSAAYDLLTQPAVGALS